MYEEHSPESIPLDERRIRLSGGIRSSYSNLHPIFTPNTTKHTLKTIKYFTIVAVMNAIMSAGWLSLVIWIGVAFADNADFDPEFLLTYFPVFMTMCVGLVVECIPLVIIIRSLRNSQVVPFPTIQVLPPKILPPSSFSSSWYTNKFPRQNASFLWFQSSTCQVLRCR